MNKREQIQAYKVILAIGQIILFVTGLMLKEKIYVIIGFYFLICNMAIFFTAKNEKKNKTTTEVTKVGSVTIEDVDDSSRVNVNVKNYEQIHEKLASDATSLWGKFNRWLHT